MQHQKTPSDPLEFSGMLDQSSPLRRKNSRSAERGGGEQEQMQQQGSNPEFFASTRRKSASSAAVVDMSLAESIQRGRAEKFLNMTTRRGSSPSTNVAAVVASRQPRKSTPPPIWRIVVFILIGWLVITSCLYGAFIMWSTYGGEAAGLGESLRQEAISVEARSRRLNSNHQQVSKTSPPFKSSSIVASTIEPSSQEIIATFDDSKLLMLRNRVEQRDIGLQKLKDTILSLHQRVEIAQGEYEMEKEENSRLLEQLRSVHNSEDSPKLREAKELIKKLKQAVNEVPSPTRKGFNQQEWKLAEIKPRYLRPEWSSGRKEKEEALALKTRGRAAIFAQVGNHRLWGDLEQCIKNVAGARNAPLDLASSSDKEAGGEKGGGNPLLLLKQLDLFIAFPNTTAREDRHFVERRVELLKGMVDKVHFSVNPNRGGDIGQFFFQLQQEQGLRAGGEFDPTDGKLKFSHSGRKSTTSSTPSIISEEEENDVSPTSLADSYAYVLKIHTKTDLRWRERMMESVCGSTAHVRSILKSMDNDLRIGMVAGLGTAFEKNDESAALFYRLVENGVTSPDKAFWGEDARKFNIELENKYVRDDYWLKIRRKNLGAHLSNALQAESRRTLAIVAGAFFWARYSALRPKILSRVSHDMIYTMTDGYKTGMDSKMEHKVERWLPSTVLAQGFNIAEAPPAPKPVLSVSLIDDSSKTWDFLRRENLHAKLENNSPGKKENEEDDSAGVLLQQPLSYEEGGLGQYDSVSDERVQERMVHLAQANGIHSFNFEYEWHHTNPPAPPTQSEQTLRKIFLKKNDGRSKKDTASESKTQKSSHLLAGFPFMLTWKPETSELSRFQYGTEKKQWKEHFDFLVEFFRNPSYIRIHGRPVLGINGAGHLFGASQDGMYYLMTRYWQQLSSEEQYVDISGSAGDGIYLAIGVSGSDWSVGGKSIIDRDDFSKRMADASMPIWPEICAVNTKEPCSSRGSEGKQLSATLRENLKGLGWFQFWGATSGFDSRLTTRSEGSDSSKRQNNKDNHHQIAAAAPTPTIHLTPEKFKESLGQSFASQGQHRNANIHQNLYFIRSWNDWAHQSVMEPSKQYKDGFLRALNEALNNIELNVVL